MSELRSMLKNKKKSTKKLHLLISVKQDGIFTAVCRNLGHNGDKDKIG
jgi:hypothetical protein